MLPNFELIMATSRDDINSSEIYENNRGVTFLPKLSIVLPQREDIGKERVEWPNINSEIPVDLLLVTVKDHELKNCYVYLSESKRSWCNAIGMVDFGKFGDGNVRLRFD